MKKLTLFITILSVAYLASCNNAQESICLMPAGYTGAIIIVFDQKDGQAPEIEDGKHVYRIPRSEILKTQVKANTRVAGHKYYWIDTMGKRTPIPYKFPNRGEDSNFSDTTSDIYCYNEQMGAIASNKPNYRQYRKFLIGPLHQIDSLSNVGSQMMFKVLLE